MPHTIERLFVIHESDPMRTFDLTFTVYHADSEIDNLEHFAMSLLAPNFTWFVVAEIDPPTNGTPNAFEGSYFLGANQGDHYHDLVFDLRNAALQLITSIYPLADYDAEDAALN